MATKTPKPQPAPGRVKNTSRNKSKLKKSSRSLTAEEQKLKSDIKRANQRLREIEKQGKEQFSSAYKEVRGQYFSQDIIEGTDIYRLTTGTKTPTNKKGKGSNVGKIMFRTDIARIKREDPEKLKLLEERVHGFLESQTSTGKGIEARKRKVKAIQKVLSEKYGNQEQFTDAAVNKMIDDEYLYNVLRVYLDSESTFYVMNDISLGKLDREQVLDYLEQVEYGKIGFNVHDMYSYSSTTSDWETEGW